MIRRLQTSHLSRPLKAGRPKASNHRRHLIDAKLGLHAILRSSSPQLLQPKHLRITVLNERAIACEIHEVFSRRESLGPMAMLHSFNTCDHMRRSAYWRRPVKSPLASKGMIILFKRIAFPLLFATSVASGQQTTIDTRGPNGMGGINGNTQCLGHRYCTPVFGQSFTTGNVTKLSSFSFWVNGSWPLVFSLRGIIAPFDPVASRLTGQAAYVSHWVQIPPIGNPQYVWSELLFETGGVVLEANAVYMAFLTADPDFVNPDQSNTGPYTGVASVGNTYSGGGMHYASWNGNAGNPNASMYPDLDAAGTWKAFGNVPGDAAFRATFAAASTTSTPEPGTLVLFATGAALVAARQKKRPAGKRAAAP
jgi:hypothetical protein